MGVLKSKAFEKLIKELKSVFLTTLYLLMWIGSLMIIKVLLLKEYNTDFSGISKVIVGSLVIAKVIMILEYINLPFFKSVPNIVKILLRTLSYLVGVFIVLVLEQAIESRMEYGGILNAIPNLFKETNIYHILVNTIVVFGALFFFNLWSIIKQKLNIEELKILLFY